MYGDPRRAQGRRLRLADPLVRARAVPDGQGPSDRRGGRRPAARARRRHRPLHRGRASPPRRRGRGRLGVGPPGFARGAPRLRDSDPCRQPTRPQRPQRRGPDRRPPTAGARERGHALRRAGLDPLGLRVPGARRVLHELRAARELPRDRRRVPAVGPRAERLPMGAGLVRALRGARLRRAGREGLRRRARPRELARPAGSADLDRAARAVPGGGLGDGERRRGRGAPVRAVRTARGLPPGHHGEPAGHHPVLGAVVPGARAARLGGAARDRVPRVDARRGLRGTLGRGGCGRGRADARVPRAPRRLVAVLPGHGLRRRRRRPDPRSGELAAAPGDAAPRRDPGGVLRRAVHAPGSPAGQRADRGRGERQRRRAGARRGRRPRRRRRDRPASAARRERAASRAPVPGPARRAAHRRRAGLPRAHRRDVRPDPVRAARLADARERPGIAPARELPVHAGGDGSGPRPARTRRGVRDVQLLPPRCVRALREHDAGGVRPRTMLRPRPARGGGACAVSADDRTRARRHRVPHARGRLGRTCRLPRPTTIRSRT